MVKLVIVHVRSLANHVTPVLKWGYVIRDTSWFSYEANIEHHSYRNSNIYKMVKHSTYCQYAMHLLRVARCGLDSESIMP